MIKQKQNAIVSKTHNWKLEVKNFKNRMDEKCSHF